MRSEPRRSVSGAGQRLSAVSALSPAVIALLVLAAMVVALGFARLCDQQLHLGVLLVGIFIAVAARICQARDHHLAVCRLLEARADQTSPR